MLKNFQKYDFGSSHLWLLGQGAIGTGLLFMILKLFNINLDQITVIDMPTKVKPKEQLIKDINETVRIVRGVTSTTSNKIKIISAQINYKNYKKIFNNLSKNDMVIDCIYDVSTLDVLKLCQQTHLKCIEIINAKGISSSGNLIDSISQPKIVRNGAEVTMTIEMADYYDYTNKGVRGIKSSKNAPGSPYSFKKMGISPEGRMSITKWVQSGKAKTSTFGSKTYGAQEKKQIQIEERVESIIQGIKKFGIKKRSWFDDAVKEVFGDFEQVMAEQIGRQISVTIKL
jgi:hypothetical protein